MESFSKNVLITGCSSGFGRATVSQFLKAGWTVYATLRNADTRQEIFARDLEKFPGRLRIFSLDVTSSEDIQQAGESFRNERLDCLVNNAGYGLFGSLEDMSEAQLREQMEVNFFGAVFLTRTLLPALRRSQGRVINVSSILGMIGMPLTSAYCSSKFALEGMTEALHYELQPFGVQVAMVEPGRYETDFSRKLLWGARYLADDSPYIKASTRYHHFRLNHKPRHFLTADQVAQIVAGLAQARKMPLRVQCGSEAHAMYWGKRLLPESWASRILKSVYGKLFYTPIE